jgi:hypothetical protein
MKTWKLCCVAGGLLASVVLWTAARGQSPQDPFAAKPQEPAKVPAVSTGSPNRALDPLTVPPGPVATSPTVPPPGNPTTPPPTLEPQSIDDVLNQLADIRAKKAELEKQEQATIKTLREKLRAQKERLAKMGVAPEEPPAKAAEGNVDLPSKTEIPHLDAPRIPEKKK